MARPIRLSLSLANLIHNFNRAQANASDAKVMAVVKANAYGHGAVQMAMALSNAGAKALAVCSIDEAFLLLEAKINIPIVLLEGFFKPGELAKIISLGLIPVIHNQEQLDILRAYKISREIKVLIKINTGMNRLGFAAVDFARVYKELANIPKVNVIGLMSHFACADEIDNPQNLQQLELFNKTAEGFLIEKSMANSAAILSLPDAHYDWIRPGIMLYGGNPMLNGSTEDYGLKPVMRFTAEIIGLQELNPGDTAGYGGTWQAQNKTRIGVVAAGYADGYPRHAPNATPVAINGKLTTLAGRVSMDMLTVDLSNMPEVKIGDQVELWGNTVSADVVARMAGTIAYELFCGISSRIPRVYE